MIARILTGGAALLLAGAALAQTATPPAAPGAQAPAAAAPAPSATAPAPAAPAAGTGAAAPAAAAPAREGVTPEDGKYFTAEGEPTFNIAADGTVDWYTFSGYRRYHAECHVCHGPDGLGSSYAPNLVESLKTMSHADFLEVVVNGRARAGATGDRVMPAFGTNLNVMCYIDDIYIYLEARAEGNLPRGRPAKREEKPAAFTENENACMGTG